MSDTTPAQAEAEGEAVEVEWLGRTISLPASPGDWDIDVTRAFARNDYLTAIEMLVGKREFAKIEKAHRAANGGRFRMEDLRPLGEKIAEIYGFGDLGN